MIKKYLSLILLCSILILSSCSERTGKSPITDVDIRTGKIGLKMEFIDNAPPEDVFEDGLFPISLRVKNNGAYSINVDDEDSQFESVSLVLGFDKGHMDYRLNGGSKKVEVGGISSPLSINELVSFEIDGKSITNLVGDEEFINFDMEAKLISGQSETQKSTILATACYPYETILGTSICIDTDILQERKGEKACENQDLSFTTGQGAPVSITKIETRMLPQDDEKLKPHFLIHVKNVGNGEIIDRSKTQLACSNERLTYRDFNTLVISATLSGVQLKCGTQEIGPIAVKLKDKEDIIRCTHEENGGISRSREAYIAPLRIELDYGYTHTISKGIIIEKVLTY
jgi:hypothetical protein